MEPPRLPLLTLAAAAAVIQGAGVSRLRSKWPNDLVVDDRKCGGVLAEAETAGGATRHVVLGMGINVSGGDEDFPEDIRGTATSLLLAGIEQDPQALLLSFLKEFRACVMGPRFPLGVPDRYRRICATVGSWVKASLASGEHVEGLAVDVDEDGGLVIVSREKGRHVIRIGEVRHLGEH
jgi:BirA family biotin operon repressor/biotin-[acetyl-CoA-carboxylase] ligase